MNPFEMVERLLTLTEQVNDIVSKYFPEGDTEGLPESLEPYLNYVIAFSRLLEIPASGWLKVMNDHLKEFNPPLELDLDFRLEIVEPMKEIRELCQQLVDMDMK
jgi:hypothetical protein